ncbi:E3 ubiquitin-protein ligase RNF4-like [Patagioenas fasciata]|uniref:E3 ubiquitin-protein ligase RNF4-like n=1 Tax=Patagioenas fasciata TaxID=372321 RepID=UPI003A994129
MSTTQRKRRGGAVNSRQARKRNRVMASTAEMASEAEPIELEESAGEEVVDLTCESSDPVVVDLTHNDSVVDAPAAIQTRSSRTGLWVSSAGIVPQPLPRRGLEPHDRICLAPAPGPPKRTVSLGLVIFFFFSSW